MHFLANTSRKELQLLQRNKDLNAAKQDAESLHEDISIQLRNSSTELATTLALLNEQCQDIDEKTLFFIQKIQGSSDKISAQLTINQTLSKNSPRITSYNVCYTKLLRTPQATK